MAHEDRKGAGDAGTTGIEAELGDLRAQIDTIDAEILSRLNERARAVQRVGEIKEGGRKGPIYVAARERDLVQIGRAHV